MTPAKNRYLIRAEMSEFVLPPIHDGLVLGKASPIGHVAVHRALGLLSTTSYDHVPIEDEVIGDILVRSAILRKISREHLIDFVLAEIKPYMGPEEIIHLELKVEIHLEVRQS